MNPKPQQAKLPAGYRLKSSPVLGDSRRRWYVVDSKEGVLVCGQSNPKIAVERALARIKREGGAL